MTKKYLFLVLLSLIITLLLLFSISKTEYIRWTMFDAEYGMWVAKNNIIKKFSGKEVVLILGDSRIVAGYKPESDYKTPVANLALGGGTPVEAYQILQRLISESTHIKQLLISFAPRHFEYHETFLGRPVLYNFYTDVEYDELYKYEIKNALFKVDLNKVDNCRFGLPMCYSPYFKYILTIGRYANNKKIYSETISKNGWHLFGTENPWSKPSEINAIKFQPDPVLDIYFDKLVSLAVLNKIPLAYYLAPLEKSSYENINPSYRADFIKYIKSKNSSIKFIDGGPVSVDFIGDGSHVNLRGAYFVTSDINKKVFFTSL